jgi:hypothetical protein
MGIERAVTRWYVRRQELQQDLVVQQVRLAQLRPGGSPERVELEQRVREAHQRLLNLGPCPKSMMG